MSNRSKRGKADTEARGGWHKCLPSRPFPATVEDADETDAADTEPPVSGIPFDIEDGDCVWATGLIPEAQYIQASSTISQQLAEGFARNTEARPTLPTGGSGLKDPIPDYVKIFGQVFSEEGFAKLPSRKPWDHAIELVPGAQPKGCKVYPCKGCALQG